MHQPGKLLSTLNAMQKRVTETQKKLSASTYNGDTAGGLVKTTINGDGELKSLVIDPAVLQEGADLVADLVMAAYNVAFTAKEKAAKEALGSMATGLMPLGLKFPGIG